jgi:hypothetical protein
MLLGEKKDGLIFEGLKKEMTNHPLKDWISSAGIKKHITFHCFSYPNLSHIQTFFDTACKSAS